MKPEMTPQVVIGSAANTGAEGESDFTISDIFRTFLSYKKFLLFSIVVGGVVAALIAYTRTPVYEATASLRIDPSRATSLGLAELTGGTGTGSSEMDTDIAIIKSDTVAIDALNLLSDNEYLRFAGVSKATGAISLDTVDLSPAQQGIVSRLQGGLSAKQVGSTQIISVTSRSNDPQLAADIANAVVSAYLKESFDSRYGSVKQIRDRLGEEMAKLRGQASDAQRKLTSFQEENNILEMSAGMGSAGQSSNITLETLRQLNTSLTQARATRILSEARMRAVHDGSPEVVASMIPTASIGALLTQRLALNSKLTELTSKFGERYTPLIELRQEIAANNARFDAAISELRHQADSDFNSASTSEQMLQNEYDKQVKLAYAQNGQEAEYAVLSTEARSASTLYDTLQSKLQQAGLDAGLNAVNILPVDRARLPLIPVEPQKTVMIGVGLFVGLFLGIGTVLFRELMSDAVVNVDQIEQRLGFHVLALVPHISPVTSEGEPVTKSTASKDSGSMLVTHFAARSRATEAFRSLRSGLLLSQRNLKTVLVSSIHAAEGKSITSVNLAIVMAQKGSKVLLVDADLRRPMIHEMFRLPNVSGLSDLLLSQETDVTPHLQTPIADLPRLQILTTGGRPSFPSELLSSPQMYGLMEVWERDFDYVIIDSAPLLVVSDSLSLTHWADALVLVVRAELTPMKGLRRLRTILSQAQTSVTGVVLNDVPENSQSYGGYGYMYDGSYYE